MAFSYTRKFKLNSAGSNLIRTQVVLDGGPGTFFTHNTASGAIEVGDLVEPAVAANDLAEFNKGGQVKKVTGTIASGGVLAGSRRFAIAVNPVKLQNLDPVNDGPNDIMNAPLADGDFVGTHYAGVFETVVVASAATYTPGQLLTWDGTATRQGSLTGTGAWADSGALQPLAEVVQATELTTGSALTATGQWVLQIRLLA